MDWASGDALAALVAARAVHFSATALVAGALLFRAVVAGPPTRASPAASSVVDARTQRLAASALAAAIITGAVWFALTAAEMGNLPLRDALNTDVLRTVAEATQFGSVAIVRLVLAVLVGAGLAFDRLAPIRWLTLAAALGLAASIAWTGHAGSGFGASGNLHVTADALHLVAASAWIGGLVPLALLLSFTRRHGSEAWAAIAAAVTQRFSVLGIASVATLIASGTINAWFLVGSVQALLVTEYGRVLIVKLALFVLMLAIAAINRTVLTPQLAASAASDRHFNALRALTRHCLYEIALGLMILLVVGWLGTLHPASHFMN
jgi:putative copper resistance protein D